MHQLIATYLFQNKQCPLMDKGHLYITTLAASPNFLNKQMDAPQQSVQFSTAEINSNGFIHYVAKQKNILVENAREEVNDFIQHLFLLGQNKINDVGTFTIKDDEVHFDAKAVNSLLTPPATAERVIHEAAEHSMLVGDKETTTTEMTEYFADEPAATDKWWIWAIALGAIALAVIFFYYFVTNQN
jgi:hypothetical protein